MNISLNIDKLLYALKQKEQIYKINSFKYYNNKKDNYSIKYQIFKLEDVETINSISLKKEVTKKYVVKKDCYNKIDLLKYLIEENKRK